MARFAIVAPISILTCLEREKLIGNTHLLLAHDVVKRPFDYSKLFNPIHNPQTRSRNSLIILDNSIVELGASVDIGIIRDATYTVEPTCVVLPDVMLDTDATIKSCSDALDKWEGLLHRGGSFMYVPQGKTTHDFIRCAEALADDPRIKFWGVPRNLVGVATLGTRQGVVRLLHSINPERRIHMLGFSDDMVDDVLSARMLEVGSIDSAVPLRLNTRMSMTMVPPPRGDWWETAEYSPLVEYNLAIARCWFGDSSHARTTFSPLTFVPTTSNTD
jgi:hypothetical protein